MRQGDIRVAARNHEVQSFRLPSACDHANGLALGHMRGGGIDARVHMMTDVRKREEAFVVGAREPFGRDTADILAATDIDFIRRRYGAL
jgi:hypothetical protein